MMTFRFPRSQRTVWIVALVGVFVASPFAQCATPIYVDNRAGSDSYNGQSPSHAGPSLGPVRSIQAALRRVSAGGTIIILPTNAPYTEDFVINAKHSLGTERFPLTIEGNGVEFIGFQPIAPEGWEHVKGGVYRLVRPYQLTTLLYSGGKNLTPVPDDAKAEFPSLLEGEWTESRGSVYFRPALERSIDSYELSQSVKPAAIVVDRASHVVIRNFRLRGYGLDAIHVRGPAKGIKIERCEITDTVRSGIAAFNNVDAEVVGCHVKNIGKAGVLAENYVKLGLESMTIENSPDRMIAGTNAVINDRGGDATPLAKGPFIRPVGWRSHAAELLFPAPGDMIVGPR